MALETNLGLKEGRIDPQIAAEGVNGALAAFRPQFRTSFQRVTSDQLPSDFTDANALVVARGSTSVTTSLSQSLPWYGGSYNVSWSGNRVTTTASLSTFNPSLGSALSASFSQPLLRNLFTDSNRVALQSAKRQRTIADLALEQRIVGTRNDVEQAYLDLIGAIESLKVAHENMDLAEKNLENFRSRVRVGVSADIEVIQAEAEVANNEEQLVVNESGIGTAEDALRALIVDPSRPDYWQVRLEPTDTMAAVPREIDTEAAVRNALENRLDLQAARDRHAITGLTRRLDENQARPDLSFSMNYQAQGTGGTQFTYGTGFPPPILSQTNRPFSSVLNDTLVGTYPTWTVGLALSYPIGESSAKASLARDRLQERQEDLSLHDLELQVAASVREAVRGVQTNYKRVEVTQKAREATERQLHAGESKFAAGLSSSFELQQQQQDLAEARITELSALIAYRKSLIQFDRVQKIP
jgi:HAE1 family hydrophobic/amphiphilic exporter-1